MITYPLTQIAQDINDNQLQSPAEVDSEALSIFLQNIINKVEECSPILYQMISTDVLFYTLANQEGDQKEEALLEKFANLPFSDSISINGKEEVVFHVIAREVPQLMFLLFVLAKYDEELRIRLAGALKQQDRTKQIGFDRLVDYAPRALRPLFLLVEKDKRFLDVLAEVFFFPENITIERKFSGIERLIYTQKNAFLVFIELAKHHAGLEDLLVNVLNSHNHFDVSLLEGIGDENILLAIFTIAQKKVKIAEVLGCALKKTVPDSIPWLIRVLKNVPYHSPLLKLIFDLAYENPHFDKKLWKSLNENPIVHKRAEDLQNITETAFYRLIEKYQQVKCIEQLIQYIQTNNITCNIDLLPNETHHPLWKHDYIFLKFSGVLSKKNSAGISNLHLILCAATLPDSADCLLQQYIQLALTGSEVYQVELLAAFDNNNIQFCVKLKDAIKAMLQCPQTSEVINFLMRSKNMRNILENLVAPTGLLQMFVRRREADIHVENIRYISEIIADNKTDQVCSRLNWHA